MAARAARTNHVSLIYDVCRSFSRLSNVLAAHCQEEQQHARWIKALSFKVKDGSLDAQEDAIHAEAVRSTIAFINKQVDRAKRGELSALNAFSIVMSIEDDILEKRFFKVFMLQEELFKEAMQKLI